MLKKMIVSVIFIIIIMVIVIYNLFAFNSSGGYELDDELGAHKCLFAPDLYATFREPYFIEGEPNFEEDVFYLTYGLYSYLYPRETRASSVREIVEQIFKDTDTSIDEAYAMFEEYKKNFVPKIDEGYIYEIASPLSLFTGQTLSNIGFHGEFEILEAYAINHTYSVDPRNGKYDEKNAKFFDIAVRVDKKYDIFKITCELRKLPYVYFASPLKEVYPAIVL